MGIVSVVIACLDNLDISFSNGWLLSKLLLEEVSDKVEVAAEQPAHQTKRKHVAALEHGFVVHACI